MKNHTPLTPSSQKADRLKRGTKQKMNILALMPLLQVDIEEKIENAPDSGYEIGVVIGSYLPFVLLIGIAYFFYYKAKKRKNLND